jgi:hypothetical protein
MRRSLFGLATRPTIWLHCGEQVSPLSHRPRLFLTQPRLAPSSAGLFFTGGAACNPLELRPFCGSGVGQRKARVWLRSFVGLQCITTSIGGIHSPGFQH